jgi:hypothetical protein
VRSDRPDSRSKLCGSEGRLRRSERRVIVAATPGIAQVTFPGGPGGWAIAVRLVHRRRTLSTSDQPAPSSTSIYVYNVRSKVVHGVELNPTEADLAQQVDRLREIARRVILSSISLRTEAGPAAELFRLIDEASFRRRRAKRHSIESLEAPAYVGYSDLTPVPRHRG